MPVLQSRRPGTGARPCRDCLLESQGEEGAPSSPDQPSSGTGRKGIGQALRSMAPKYNDHNLSDVAGEQQVANLRMLE